MRWWRNVQRNVECISYDNSYDEWKDNDDIVIQYVADLDTFSLMIAVSLYNENISVIQDVDDLDTFS